MNSVTFSTNSRQKGSLFACREVYIMIHYGVSSVFVNLYEASQEISMNASESGLVLRLGGLDW